MKVKYLLDTGAIAPEKAHKDDAGFDLRLPMTFKDGLTVSAWDSVTVDTGVHIQIPSGYVGFLKSKSGLNVFSSLTGTGVIDAGYTGSIRVKLYNHSDNPHHFAGGDKLIQLVILPIPEVELEQADALAFTDRGENGFGSSGR